MYVLQSRFVFAYFDSFMSEARTVSGLIGLGLLCLAGGYALEITPKLVAKMETSGVSGLRKGLRNGLLLGAIQIAIVLDLGGKLIYDRATRPLRVGFVPSLRSDLPIRGRYLGSGCDAGRFKYNEPTTRRAIGTRIADDAAELRGGQLFHDSRALAANG